MARPLLVPPRMEQDFQTRDPFETPEEGTGRRPGFRARLRRSQRAHALAIALLLVLGAWAVGQPVPGLGWLASRVAHGPTHPRDSVTELARRISEAAAAGRLAEVAATCSLLVAHHPNHDVAEPARVRRVQALIAAGESERATRAFDDFRRHHPDSDLLPELLLDVAAWQYESGAFLDAARTYTDLVGTVTRNGMPALAEDTAPKPLIVRSLSLWRQLRRAERSRTEMERLARFNQALAFEQAGNRDGAHRAYDHFLARFPLDARAPEARFRLAAILLEAGDSEEAIDAFRAIYEDPKAPAAFRTESVYRAGRCLEALRRSEAAATSYAAAMTLQPANDTYRLSSLMSLARLVESREPQRAVAIYRELALVSTETAVRAAALQRLSVLEGDAGQTR